MGHISYTTIVHLCYRRDMQKISNHLWFDKGQAKEAADLYTSVFKDAKITSHSVLHDTPSGSVDLVTMDIADQGFTLLGAGPEFKFNPSISFLVGCETKEEVDEMWAKLSQGGFVMMELGSYPFSDRYGWTTDKYGVSWQIMLTDKHYMSQSITPTLMFVQNMCGKTEEAVNFYTSVFHDSKIDHFDRYNKGEEPDKEGTIRHAGFVLEGQHFAAMDSAHDHKFQFNEAISFIIHCETQEEIDYYWEKLSAVPESEQCGWLKDKYGVSWQVVPNILGELMSKPGKGEAVTKAFLQMKKFDIEALKKAAE